MKSTIRRVLKEATEKQKEIFKTTLNRLFQGKLLSWLGEWCVVAEIVLLGDGPRGVEAFAVLQPTFERTGEQVRKLVKVDDIRTAAKIANCNYVTFGTRKDLRVLQALQPERAVLRQRYVGKKIMVHNKNAVIRDVWIDKMITLSGTEPYVQFLIDTVPFDHESAWFSSKDIVREVSAALNVKVDNIYFAFLD